MMRRFTVAAFLAVVFVSDTIAAEPGDTQKLKAVCGQIAGINAPIDVHAKATLFGLVIRAPQIYPNPPPPGSPSDSFLGVSRANPNASGIMAVLSSAYVTRTKVLVVYDEADLFAYCVQTQERDCPDTSYKPACIDTPLPQK
jgi:hypothetical protein